LGEDPDATFKPAINERSKDIAEYRRREEAMCGNTQAGAADVTTRLTAEAETAVLRKHSLRQAWEEKEAQDYTFTPALNPESERILAESARHGSASAHNGRGGSGRGGGGGGGEAFLRRQRQNERRRAANKQRLAAEVEAESGCTFKPNIGNAEEVLGVLRPSLLKESTGERVSRMSRAEPRERQEKLQAKREEYYSQFHHAPELNPLSRALGRALTVEELVSTERNRRVKQRVAAQVTKARLQECTFKPKLHQGTPATRKDVHGNVIRGERPRGAREGADLGDPSTITQRTEFARALREEELEGARREREMQQLQDCTFVPALDKPLVPQGGVGAAAGGPVVVRGLGRFLELKELAKHIEEEKRQREEAAFRVQEPTVLGASVGGRTVPQPFRLSGPPPNSTRRERGRQDAEAAAGQYTFQPHTLEGDNRKLIDHMLRAEELSRHAPLPRRGGGAPPRY
jgi:hypothetical protein